MNLAYHLRPRTLDEFVGQEHLVGPGKLLRLMIEESNLSSMIFWGPPGTGKTTLAQIIASTVKADFHHLSAVETGKNDLREIILAAQKNRDQNIKTILFIDEIHRWNKAQQDALLPNVESGLITLIGATTENPSFEVISALQSRSKIFVLQGLSWENLETILNTALSDKERGLGDLKKTLDPEAKNLLVRLSGGDARIMLNALEIAATSFKEKKITSEIVKEVFQTKSAGIYDKRADEHYNTISAFIKSLRGSDPDAALYYLVRMLENGEDPKLIARRLVIFASEDVGLAQPTALVVANEVFRSVDTIGLPEAALNLAHGVLYLAISKKSRAVANALAKAQVAVTSFPNEPIPLHLRNAPTKDSTVGQSFLPEKLKGSKFFQPEEQNAEKQHRQ